MDLNFQFQFLNTVILIRDYQGGVIKVSRDVPISFYQMVLIGDDIYYDYNDNSYWKKSTSTIFIDNYQYTQEEYNNVTKLLLEKEKLLEDLKKDPLTKISNINAVEEMKKQIIKTKKDCTFVMCDVNDFKIINDVYGHVTGDRVLIEIANLFVKYTRNDQDLVARIGGDEFLFIFVTDNYLSIMEKMEKLQDEVDNLGRKLNIPLSISLGVASYNENDDWLTKRKKADAALYYVKYNTDDKKNIAYYNSETDDFELRKKQNVKKKKFK